MVRANELRTCKRAPGGLAHLGQRDEQRRLDLAVQRRRHQHLFATRTGRVNDEPAVWREGRALVIVGLADLLGLAGRQVHHTEAEVAVDAGDVGHRAAIGADGRADVVVAVEGHALGSAAADGHAIDLRAAAAVADEIDLAAVRRVAGLGVDGAALREAAQAGAVAVDHEELGAAFARQAEGQLLPIRRPGRCAVGALEVGQHAALAGLHVLDAHRGLAALEAHIGQLPAIGRPGRRDDRLGAGQRHLGTLAVRIGHDEAVARPGLGDIGHASREDPLVTGELFVDDVGDAVGRQPGIVRQHGLGLTDELRALDDIPELEADVQPAIGEFGDRAGDQGIGLAGPPIGPDRAAGLAQAARRVDAAELATALQVRTDDGRDRLRRLGLIAEVNDGQRHAGAANAGDVDAHLRECGAGAESGAQHNQGREAPTARNGYKHDPRFCRSGAPAQRGPGGTQTARRSEQHDVVMLGLVGRLGRQRDRLADEVRQAGEMGTLLVEQHLHHIGRRNDAELLRRELPRLAQDLAQDVIANRTCRLDLAAALAGWAGFAEHARQRLARALARHLDQTELGEAADRDLGAVAAELLPELGQHRGPVLLARHVDEVDDDDAAQVAQTQLAGDGARGFEVGLEDGVVEVLRADEAAGVHVDGRHRLGLVEHQRATGLQFHLARQRTGDLGVDIAQVEDRPLAAVVLQLGRGGRHEGLAELAQHLVLHARVDADMAGALVGQVAQHALNQAEILVQQAGRRRGEGLLADLLPGLAQIGDVGGEFVVARVLGIGAQDEAAAAALLLGADERLHAGAQRLTGLGRADLLADADVLILRQIDQHATGDADLAGQPRALGADRVLDDLDRQRLPFEDQSLDRRRRRIVALVAAMAELRGAVQIGHMQEGRALQADVDEGALHAGQHAHHLAEVDVADQAPLQGALEVQLLHRPVLDHGHARLLRRPVDQDVFHHEPLNADPCARAGAQRSELETEFLQQTGGLKEGQPHDAGVAARNVHDPGRRLALDRISPGLAEGLPARDVALDLRRRQRCELDLRHAHRRGLLRGVAHRDGRDDAVGAARHQRQHARRIGLVGRLAEDEVVDRHRRVGAQDGRLRQAPRHAPGQRGVELGRRHACAVGLGRLAGLHGLQALGVLVGARQQQLMPHTDLIQQLAAAWALRGEVEKVGHSR
uniref:Uncharacterized protein n=1 Tax=Heterosigma akashiwo TaxID=2829 RepID=A0A7S4D5R6_HETAK